MDDRYHLQINQKGYIVQNESYKKLAQLSYRPRFSTGDPSVNDLSFWQFFSQDDWRGGLGYKKLDFKDVYDEAFGINTHEQFLQLTPEVLPLVDDDNNPLELGSALEKQAISPDTNILARPSITEFLGRLLLYNLADQADYEQFKMQSFLIPRITKSARQEIIEPDLLIRPRFLWWLTNPVEGSGMVFGGCSPFYIKPGQQAKMLFHFDTWGIGTNSEVNFAIAGLDWYFYSLENIYFRIRSDPARTSTFSLKIKAQLCVYAETMLEGEIDTELVPTVIETIGERTINARIRPRGDYQILEDPASMRDLDIKIPDKIEPGEYMICVTKILNWDGTDRIYERYYVQPIAVVDKRVVEPYPEGITIIPHCYALEKLGDKLVVAADHNGKCHIRIYTESEGKFTLDNSFEIDEREASSSSTVNFVAMKTVANQIVIALDNELWKFNPEGSSASDRWNVDFGDLPGEQPIGMAIFGNRLYVAMARRSTWENWIVTADLNTELITESYAVQRKGRISAIGTYAGALLYSFYDPDKEGYLFGYPEIKVNRLKDVLGRDCGLRCLNIGRYAYYPYSHSVSVLGLSETGSSPLASIDLGSSDMNIIWDIEEVGREIFFLLGNNIWHTNPDRFIREGWIKSASIDMSTPLINKLWSEISVELAEPLPPQTSVKLYVKESEDAEFSEVGELKTAGLKKQGFAISQTSPTIFYKLKLISTNGLSSPKINRVSIRYILEDLDKWSWVFAVRCDDNLQLRNGENEPRNSTDIESDLRTAKSDGIIRFMDVDDQEFWVVVTDMQIRKPLLKDDNESIIFLELLEV